MTFVIPGDPNTAARHELPALRHFRLDGGGEEMPPPLLAPLLEALHCCAALTYLAFQDCVLTGLPEGCSLPASLRVARADFNPDLHLAQWLPHLAALPLCHTITLLGCGRTISASALVRAGLGAAPALQFLQCTIDDPAPLVAARSERGLPPLTVGEGREWGEGPWKAWELRCNALLRTPDISYGLSAVLPMPQLDTASCCYEL